MICQYCGGENVSTEYPRNIETEVLSPPFAKARIGGAYVPFLDGRDIALEAVARVYWQNYRGIGKSSEAIEFTDALGKALGEYKGDGA
jgi:hypothetical protein